jgi:hypothetical protein
MPKEDSQSKNSKKVFLKEEKSKGAITIRKRKS